MATADAGTEWGVCGQALHEVTAAPNPISQMLLGTFVHLYTGPRLSPGVDSEALSPCFRLCALIAHVGWLASSPPSQEDCKLTFL